MSELDHQVEKIYSDLEIQLMLIIAKQLDAKVADVVKALQVMKQGGKVVKQNLRNIQQRIMVELRDEYEHTLKNENVLNMRDLPKIPKFYLKTLLDDFTQRAYSRLAILEDAMIKQVGRHYVQAVNTITQLHTTGLLTFGQAREQAVNMLTETGIMKLYDKAGRGWSMEGYVSTVMNTERAAFVNASQDARGDMYGLDVFQVSGHVGARPLCYPYQNKYYSRKDIQGTIKDVNDREFTVHPLSSTSFGQKAGLFGINCGHGKFYVEDGYFVHVGRFVANEEDNALIYGYKQKQRTIEKSIRNAKKRYALQEESGADDKTLAKYKARIKAQQMRMRELLGKVPKKYLIKRDYERERILTTVL